MLKYYCDSCFTELKESELTNAKEFPVAVHVVNEDQDEKLSVHVDGNMNPISGRKENYLLCIECYNELMGTAYEKLKEMGTRHNSPILSKKDDEERPKYNLLYDTNYLQLKELVDEERGINGYIYSHEIRCNGEIVAILPYRWKNYDGSELEFLLRSEVTPCWGLDEHYISCITGGVENGDPNGTAVLEMKEEAGYKISTKELEKWGTCFGTKSSDTIYHLYTVDLTGKKGFEAQGDGSELEAKAECIWKDDISDGVDPFLYVLHYKLCNLYNY